MKESTLRVVTPDVAITKEKYFTRLERAPEMVDSDLEFMENLSGRRLMKRIAKVDEQQYFES
jgi:hypothetical protein